MSQDFFSFIILAKFSWCKQLLEAISLYPVPFAYCELRLFFEYHRVFFLLEHPLRMDGNISTTYVASFFFRCCCCFFLDNKGEIVCKSKTFVVGTFLPHHLLIIKCQVCFHLVPRLKTFLYQFNFSWLPVSLWRNWTFPKRK